MKNKSLNFDLKQYKVVDFKNRPNSPFIIPNISLLARELTSNSQIKIIINRVLKLGFLDVIKIGLTNIRFIPKILKKDFAAGIKILCQIEIAFSQKKDYLLHSQITDMSVALNNKNIIEHFFKLSKDYQFRPKIFTCNLGPLINFLSTFPSLPKDLVIFATFDENNYLTNPKYQDLEEFIQKTPITIVKVNTNSLG